MIVEDTDNPTLAVQLAAVKHTWDAIKHIKNPTDKVSKVVAHANLR